MAAWGCRRLPSAPQQQNWSKRWQDARHQFAATVPQPRGRPAPHAFPAMAATAAATATARPTLAPGPATAAVAGRAGAAVQGRAGRASVRQCRTRLPRWRHSRRSARLLKKKRRRSQTLRNRSSFLAFLTTAAQYGGGRPLGGDAGALGVPRNVYEASTLRGQRLGPFPFQPTSHKK